MRNARSSGAFRSGEVIRVVEPGVEPGFIVIIGHHQLWRRWRLFFSTVHGAKRPFVVPGLLSRRCGYLRPECQGRKSISVLPKGAYRAHRQRRSSKGSADANGASLAPLGSTTRNEDLRRENQLVFAHYIDLICQFSPSLRHFFQNTLVTLGPGSISQPFALLCKLAILSCRFHVEQTSPSMRPFPTQMCHA